MPGATPDDKKMNFSLFRRGKLTLEDIATAEDGRSGIQKKRMQTRHLAIARSIRLANEVRRIDREDGEWHAPPPTITGLEAAEPPPSRHRPLLPNMKGRKANPITERQLRLRERFMALEEQVGHGFGVRFAEHCNYKTRSNFRHLVQGTRGLGDAVLDLIEKGLESWPEAKAEGGGRKAEVSRYVKMCEKLSVPAALLDAPVPRCLDASALQELTAACERLQSAAAEVKRLALACATTLNPSEDHARHPA